tara:strand:- start:1472 stop:2068 length:597 start_codon:yes stop_codon:yes gene_type:complete
MKKQLLREFYELCPDGACLDVLTETEKREMSEGKSLYLVGKCHEAEALNGNNRKYPFETLKREINKYMEVVKDRRALGELDHPDDSVVNLKNSSHMIVDLWWDDKSLMGKLKVLSTPSGMTLKALVTDGVKIGISSRGLGSVVDKGSHVMVEEDFQLICFDVVSEPSTPLAFMDNVVYEGRTNIPKLSIKNMIDDILS